MTTQRRPTEAVEAAAYYANRCRSLLRGRIGDAPITVETLVHDDGGFTATAFHTVWESDTGPNFAREIVEYESGDGSATPGDDFKHDVEHYFSGHHEVCYRYRLDEITE